MGMPPPLSRSLVGIVRSADLVSAARLMVKKNIGALGVYSTNEHELLGIITERDITRSVAGGLNPADTRVTQAMSDSPIIVDGPISRFEATEMMRREHVRHLIIRMNGSHRIVSIRDL